MSKINNAKSQSRFQAHYTALELVIRFCIIIICAIVCYSDSATGKDITIAPHKFKLLDNTDVPDDIAFFDEKGEKHFLENYEGKTILLVFWATWCSNCANEMVSLDILQKDFRKLNFLVLPISEDYSGIESVEKFYKQYHLTHLRLLHDYKNALFKAFHITSIPTSVIINPDGKAVGIFAGDVSWHDEKVREILLSHISGNPTIPKNTHKDKSLMQTLPDQRDSRRR
ncbi:MAG UNVERIFIED_CONTAM: TlpA family protein disulfide reductase [Rickettsiaceae bacterium]|jgi:peroxiredoxin